MQPGMGPPYGGGGGGVPPASATPEAPATTNVGLILALVWLFFGFVGCIATALAGVTSESLGVTVSYVGMPLLLGGIGAVIVAPFVRGKGQAAAIGAPIGCGCLGALVGFVATVVFFVAIFPSL